MSPPRIAIVVGSTRPGRAGIAVAQWVLELARKRSDATFELLDLADQKLPLYDEPIPAGANKYQHPHTKAWAEKVARYDGFVFVTPEYDHGAPASLTNALEYLYAEWTNKAAGFVSYGSAGGVRAVEHLRGMMAELQIADVRANPALSFFDDFDQGKFKPRERHEKVVTSMLDQVIAWSNALRPLRGPGA